MVIGRYRVDDMEFRGIKLLDGFPIENEEILNQLYGCENLKIPILIGAFDSHSVTLIYDLDTKECNLQKHRFGTLVDEIKFSTLPEMLKKINETGVENIF